MSARSEAWRLSAAALTARVGAGDLSVTDAVESGWAGPAVRWESEVHAVAHADAEARAAGFGNLSFGGRHATV